MKQPSYFCRAALLLLVLAALLSLPGCSKYRLEMSTAAQSETMLTMGETEVPFEVVYFFYHNYQEAYPKEDLATRMQRIENSVCELYAIFDVSERYGIAPFGDKVNELLDEAVKEMIDSYPTRRDYIDRLADQHMSDSVSRLLLRSYLCQELLLEELLSELKDDAVVDAFLARTDVLRVLSLTVNFGDQTEAMRRRAEEIVALLEAEEDTDEAFLSIARHKATTDQEHSYITVGQWYQLCGEGAPAPENGAFSGPLYEGETCLMMRVSTKDEAYAKANRDKICPGYLECLIADRAAEKLPTLQKTEAYRALTADKFQ